MTGPGRTGGAALSVALAHAFPGFALDLAFEAPPGVTALFGPSGSGKTTVVNAVAGLLRPDRGRIVAGGAVLLDTAAGVMVPPHRRRVGYVFQDGRLLPHLTVRQNLLYGRWFAPGPARWFAPAAADRREAAADLDRVAGLLGLEALLGRRPAALSGGEAQRVAIGRAILSRPRILLMDEPLAALDEARRAEIMPYLERLRDEAVVPILYVSHSAREVARLATTVVRLVAGRIAPVAPEPGPPPGPLRAVAASVAEGRLTVDLADGRTLSVPLAWFPRLMAATPEERARLRIGREALHWDDLGEEVALARLLAPPGET